MIIAALLGAEEFGFATTALVAMGCIMMRVCHLDTCPVGVATQHPELRKKFMGDPDQVVNFLRFIAQDMREIMAQLGVRTINELIGRTDLLHQAKTDHWKAKYLDLSPILEKPDADPEIGRYCQIEQDHGLENAVDNQILLELCEPALKDGSKVRAKFDIKIPTAWSAPSSAAKSPAGRSRWPPEDTVDITFEGSADNLLRPLPRRASPSASKATPMTTLARAYAAAN